MIYHYLCIADKYLITVYSQEDSSQEELTFIKHSFSEWTKLNSVLEGFKDHPVVYIATLEG